MKRFNCYFRTLCVAVFVFLTTAIPAEADTTPLQQMDSVEISLLTCSPGQEVWSLYGHTAIRLRDPLHNQDLAINYGMFNFNQKNFILRFVFGLTDYEMGIVPFQMFMMEYAREGRGVIQQRLNLTNDEKAAIIQAISVNYEPANRTYRYNYFYDNCTTRARDILANHLNGKVEYAVNQNATTSYREMTHQWNTDHRWARFGNDLLLGLKADFKTNYTQQQFLPEHLSKAFSQAKVVEVNGKKRPLVSQETEILKPNALNVEQESSIWDTITPRMLFLSLSILIALITLYELKRKKTVWLLDVTLLTLDGLAGLILFAMFFSQHPTVSLNLQILLLNPLSIIFVYQVVYQEIKKEYHWYWNLLGLCIILFFIGGFFQDYAEGTYFLALALLLRVGINYYITHQGTVES
ncbi:MAG: DUF4105 domain-containing protein [Prevotella sp.]|nr:DUF4105 domain-containing protein [Prevotella sp.]